MPKAATTYLKASNSQRKRSFKTLKSVRSLYKKTSVHVGMKLIDEYHVETMETVIAKSIAQISQGDRITSCSILSGMD